EDRCVVHEECGAWSRAFVAVACHELRTPLTTVRGYAELYRRGAATDARALEVMGRIEAAAIRMGVLVEDLLLLANLDAERPHDPRSEEHTSELQSRENLVCRLLL